MGKGLKATIIYPGIIYGCYAKNLVSQAIKMVQSGKIKKIKGGEKGAPLIYVDELCDLFIRAAISEKTVGRRYISVKGLEAGIHDLIEIIAREIGFKGIADKVYPRLPLFVFSILAGFFCRLFNKKITYDKSLVNRLSINMKNVNPYGKKYDDPKEDLNWEQDTSREFLIKKVGQVIEWLKANSNKK